MSSSANPAPVLKGGAGSATLDLLQKYAQPFNIYVGILLVVGITYVGQVPDSITYQANSILGRLLLFFLTIIVADTYSWIYGFLMALFTILLIAMAPRTQTRSLGAEGFQGSDSDSDVKLISQKKKWWVEEVLQENPIGIEDEKVRTSAIQDSSNSSSSTQSSSTP